MTADAYYRFFVGDYLKKTGGLTLLEHGAYRVMLDYLYSEEELPADHDRLYRMCRAFTPEERAAIDHVAAKYFVVDGDRLVNRRAKEEIQTRRAFREEQRRKGKLGGRPAKAGAKPEVKPRVKPGKSCGLAGAKAGVKPKPKPNESPSASASASEPPPEKNKGTRASAPEERADAPPRSGGNGTDNKAAHSDAFALAEWNPNKAPDKAMTPDAMMGIWNDFVKWARKEYCEDCLTPPVRKLTAARRKQCLARIESLGLTLRQWFDALNAMYADDWFSGRKPSRTHQNWVADFDWVIRSDENLLRLLERNDAENGGGEQRPGAMPS